MKKKYFFLKMLNKSMRKRKRCLNPGYLTLSLNNVIGNFRGVMAVPKVESERY